MSDVLNKLRGLRFPEIRDSLPEEEVSLVITQAVRRLSELERQAQRGRRFQRVEPAPPDSTNRRGGK